MRVSAFVVWTHVVAALGFGALYFYTQMSAYGIDRSGPLWGGFGDLMIFVMSGVLLILGVPTLLVEVGAVRRGAKALWLARLAVVGYLAVGGWWAFLPGGLRFFGDTSPVRAEDLTLGLACHTIIATTQAIGAYLACRWRIVSRGERSARGIPPSSGVGHRPELSSRPMTTHPRPPGDG